MYKFRHTIKLDEYSGAVVEILVDEESRLSVRAIDLIGDAWDDFLEALVRAEEFEKQGRIRERNQEVQTCFVKLLTHLDGVVSGMCKCLEKTLDNFSLPKYGRRKDCTLAEKIDYVTKYVIEPDRLALKPLDLSFKVFRDLLIHPYVKKSLRKSQHQRRELGQGDIFDVTLDELKLARSMVDQWLGGLTQLFEYPRGYHTERLARDFSQQVRESYARHGGELPDTPIVSRAYRI